VSNRFAIAGPASRVTAANFGHIDIGFGLGQDTGRAVKVLNFTSLPMGCLDSTAGQQNPRHGMCSLHFDVKDVGPQLVLTEFPIPNQYLVADVTYGTAPGGVGGAGGGGVGGRFSVGITKGTVIAVGGVDVISVEAYYMPAHLDLTDPTHPVFDPLALYREQIVQVTATWPTSINPKEATIAFPSFDIVANTPSPLFAVPEQVSSVLVYTNVPASLPGLELRLFRANTAGIPAAYVTLNPNANGTHVESGVRFFQLFHATQNQRVTPVFALFP